MCHVRLALNINHKTEAFVYYYMWTLNILAWSFNLLVIKVRRWLQYLLVFVSKSIAVAALKTCDKWNVGLCLSP